jgi:secretion/DNA translocation related TadE-like protein
MLGRVAVDQRRAAAAADLAALAGATELQYGRPGCSAAARIAAENGAEVVGCADDDDLITVAVVVPAQLLGWHLELRGRARAGPVDG